MAAGTQSRVDLDGLQESNERPAISVCEGAPGRSVFLESGNNDGWIATDTTVDIER